MDEQSEQDRTPVEHIAAFNHELALRLDALDHGERLDPAQVRERLKKRSRERLLRTRSE